jgi:hypothetical protein
MTSIRCQDTVFLTTDFDTCVSELRASHAAFQAPLHATIPPGRRFGVPRIRAHDLIVEFDETRIPRAAVLSILAKYGCHERVPAWGASPGGAVPTNPAPLFVSVITTQMT